MVKEKKEKSSVIEIILTIVISVIFLGSMCLTAFGVLSESMYQNMLIFGLGLFIGRIVTERE